MGSGLRPPANPKRALSPEDLLRVPDKLKNKTLQIVLHMTKHADDVGSNLRAQQLLHRTAVTRVAPCCGRPLGPDVPMLDQQPIAPPASTRATVTGCACVGVDLGFLLTV